MRVPVSVAKDRTVDEPRIGEWSRWVDWPLTGLAVGFPPRGPCSTPNAVLAELRSISARLDALERQRRPT